jgi:hypothetical protein
VSGCLGSGTESGGRSNFAELFRAGDDGTGFLRGVFCGDCGGRAGGGFGGGVAVVFKGGGTIIGGGNTGGKGREERINAGEGDEGGGVGGAVLDAAEVETRGEGSVRTN